MRRWVQLSATHVFENSRSSGESRYSAFRLQSDGTAAIDIHDTGSTPFGASDEYESVEIFSNDQVAKMCRNLEVTHDQLIAAIKSRFTSLSEFKTALQDWEVGSGEIHNWF
nr:hypothetical protein [Propionimicrobium lymphophilum]